MKRKYLIGIIVGIFVLWAGSAAVIYYCIDKDFRGITGDMFGAINALFSGLAFAGLIYTIAVQREELQEQRKSIEMQTDELSLQRQAIEMQTEELKMQREETARSADQLEMQQKLLNYQLLLVTINDLIKLKNEAINSLEMIFYDQTNPSLPGSQYNGRSAFKKLTELSKHRSVPLLEHNQRKAIEQYKNTCFLLFEMIFEDTLSNKQISNLKKIVLVNIKQDEIIILHRLAKEDSNQKQLELFKEIGLML